MFPLALPRAHQGHDRRAACKPAYTGAGAPQGAASLDPLPRPSAPRCCPCLRGSEVMTTALIACSGISEDVVMDSHDLEDRLMEAPVPVLRYIWQHAWEVADRTFKLVGWMAGIAAFQSVAKHQERPELLVIALSLILLWWLAVFVSLMTGVGHAVDTVGGKMKAIRPDGLRLFLALCVGMAATAAAMVLLSAFGTLFTFLLFDAVGAGPAVPGRP